MEAAGSLLTPFSLLVWAVELLGEAFVPLHSELYVKVLLCLSCLHLGFRPSSSLPSSSFFDLMLSMA